jgi:hypothetical protein
VANDISKVTHNINDKRINYAENACYAMIQENVEGKFDHEVR